LHSSKIYYDQSGLICAVVNCVWKHIYSLPEIVELLHCLIAVVLVGERKDSQTYVASKKKGCAEVGFESFGTDLPETATEEMVLKVSE
jgi:5,10-methylene-tetrahydrofolate dehydrogenase/methenyl tetrahydrofolate cyclohydrolase